MANIVDKNSFTIFDSIKNNETILQSNANLINEMVMKEDMNISVKPFGEKKQDVITSIASKRVIMVDADSLNFTDDENVQVFNCVKFDSLDKIIFDAILTLYFRKQKSFTIHQIVKMISGTNPSCISKVKIKSIEERIDNMIATFVKINCKDELALREVSEETIDIMEGLGQFIPVSKYTMTMKNKTKTTAYIMTNDLQNPKDIFKCPMFAYLIISKQLITIDTNNFYPNLTRHSDEFDIIQQYILGRIELMKNSKNNMNNHNISFDASVKDKRNLYNFCGIRQNNYSDKNWYLKQKKIIDMVETILKYQIEIKNIKKYEFIYSKDRKIPISVNIKV